MTVSLIFVAGRTEKLLKSRGGGAPWYSAGTRSGTALRGWIGACFAISSSWYQVWYQISGTRSGSWWPPPAVSKL